MTTWSPDSSFIDEAGIPEKLTDLLKSAINEQFTNLVRGAHASKEHYLEAWYRMTREDFMAPLRTAVSQYRNVPKDNRTGPIRLDGGFHYYFPRILASERDGEDILYRLELFGMDGVDWPRLNRHNSFLLLSSDHFETARHGLVTLRREDRNSRDNVVHEQEAGSVLVRVQGDPLDKTEYHGIEPTALWEPTRCVLERLQQLAKKVKGGDDLPFQRYIVEANTSVRPPSYVSRSKTVILEEPEQQENMIASDKKHITMETAYQSSEELIKNAILCGELCLEFCPQCRNRPPALMIRVSPCGHELPLQVMDQYMWQYGPAPRFCPLPDCGALITGCARYQAELKMARASTYIRTAHQTSDISGETNPEEDQSTLESTAENQDEYQPQPGPSSRRDAGDHYRSVICEEQQLKIHPSIIDSYVMISDTDAEGDTECGQESSPERSSTSSKRRRKSLQHSPSNRTSAKRLRPDTPDSDSKERYRVTQGMLWNEACGFQTST